MLNTPFVCGRWSAALLSLGLFVCGSFAFGQKDHGEAAEAPPAADHGGEHQIGQEGEHAAQPEARTKARRQAVLVGSMLLALVILVGVAVIAFIMVLGKRTRRIASQPLPDTSNRDELWYLRRNRSPLDPDDDAL